MLLLEQGFSIPNMIIVMRGAPIKKNPNIYIVSFIKKNPFVL